MTKEDAIAHFGSGASVGRALGIQRAAVSAWGPTIPWIWQCAIQVVTDGALVAEPRPESESTTRNRSARMDERRVA